MTSSISPSDKITEYRNSTCSIINSIPSDIISKVFSFLPMNTDRYKKSFVCRNWYISYKKISLKEISHIKFLASSLLKDLARNLDGKIDEINLQNYAKQTAALVDFLPEDSPDENIALINNFSSNFFSSNRNRIRNLLILLRNNYGNLITDLSSYPNLKQELGNLIKSLNSDLLKKMEDLSKELQIDLIERFTEQVEKSFFFFNQSLIINFDSFFKEFKGLPNIFEYHPNGDKEISNRFNLRPLDIDLLDKLKALLFNLSLELKRNDFLEQPATITSFEKYSLRLDAITIIERQHGDKYHSRSMNYAFSILLENGEYHRALRHIEKIKKQDDKSLIILDIAAGLLKKGTDNELAINLIQKNLPNESNRKTMNSFANALKELIKANGKEKALSFFDQVYELKYNRDIFVGKLLTSLLDECEATTIPFIIKFLKLDYNEITPLCNYINRLKPSNQKKLYTQIGEGLTSCLLNSENFQIIFEFFNNTDNKQNKVALFKGIAKSAKDHHPNFVHQVLSHLIAKNRNQVETISILQSIIKFFLDENLINHAEAVAEIIKNESVRIFRFTADSRSRKDAIRIEYGLAVSSIEARKKKIEEAITPFK